MDKPEIETQLPYMKVEVTWQTGDPSIMDPMPASCLIGRNIDPVSHGQEDMHLIRSVERLSCFVG